MTGAQEPPRQAAPDAAVERLARAVCAAIPGASWADSPESRKETLRRGARNVLAEVAPLMGGPTAAVIADERQAILREIEAAIRAGEAGASPNQHLTYRGGLRRAARIVRDRIRELGGQTEATP